MKTLISLIILLVSMSAVAGISGSRPSPDPVDSEFKTVKPNTEIVFALNSNNEVTRFQRGRYVDNRWVIEEFKVPSDFKIDSEVIKALELSRRTKNWAPTIQ